jgi:glycosyltransferase involved in cell wall biosynthesis
MRIVQVVQGLPPESLGGTETYVAHLSQALARRGHEVRVFSRLVDLARPEDALDEVVREGIAITRINNPFHLGAFVHSYENPTIARHFGAFLDSYPPDVVHIHHLMYLSTSCVQEAARRGIPVVMTLHDYWLICQRGRFLKPDLTLCPGQTDEGCARCFAHLLDRRLAPLYQWLKPILGKRSWMRDFLRRLHGTHVAARRPSPEALQQIQQRMAHVRRACEAVSLFLAPSRFLREQFLTFGIAAEKIVFAECGLPPQPSFPTRDRPPGSPPVFGYIGVVDPVKGVHLLVDAFQPLTGAELHIYGGETDYAPYPDRGHFLAQLRRSPHIRLMGRYDNSEVAKILSEVDVVVAPSIWYENAPLVIREAFLARKPVITAAFGGMQEWVQDGVNGLLFPPRDVENLRRTLARFITEPDLVEKLSQHFPRVKTIAEDAWELEARYRRLMERGA